MALRGPNRGAGSMGAAGGSYLPCSDATGAAGQHCARVEMPLRMFTKL